jgi:hypothetical protein
MKPPSDAAYFSGANQASVTAFDDVLNPFALQANSPSPVDVTNAAVARIFGNLAKVALAVSLCPSAAAPTNQPYLLHAKMTSLLGFNGKKGLS